MSRIKTIATRDLNKSVQNGGCGECQTSCQSACKTSCGVANQPCENSNRKSNMRQNRKGAVANSPFLNVNRF